MFDVERFATRESRENEDRAWYTVDFDAVVPALVEHIRVTLQTNGLPTELIDLNPHPEIAPAQAARMHIARARAVAATAWDDALRPLFDRAFPSPEEVQVALALAAQGDELPEAVARLMRRAQALQTVRLWFTRALKTKFGPVGIHWVGSDAFKDGMP